MAEPRRRVLTLFDVTCIGVNAIIGSSIFLFPGQLAARLGPASILAFGLTGLLLSTVALCFAEAGGRFEGHGGPYLYARATLGPTVGFGVGWLCWLTEILSWAAVADGVSTYLGYFHPWWSGALATKLVAAAVILVMGAINYRGVKLGAWTTNAFTVAKLVPLALLVLAGVPKAHMANFRPFAPHGLRPLGGACFLAYFAFQGFEVAPVPAGEAVDPRRAVPVAVLGSLAISSVFYMLVQTAAVGLVPSLGSARWPTPPRSRWGRSAPRSSSRAPSSRRSASTPAARSAALAISPRSASRATSRRPPRPCIRASARPTSPWR